MTNNFKIEIVVRGRNFFLKCLHVYNILQWLMSATRSTELIVSRLTDGLNHFV